MKLRMLRTVTLTLLFVLLADAVYAGSGDGPTPGQRQQRRDNNNNGGQRQQGQRVPQGGGQVLPVVPQNGGINLDQLNRRLGNPQNQNEADVDTRNNPVARPAVPTDDDPAVRLVPNAGPAAGTATVPTAQPNQGRVQQLQRQLQQQLGPEQMLGDQGTPAGPPPDANRRRPRVLGDANQLAPPKNSPPPPPNPLDAPPGQGIGSPPNQNRPIPILGNQAASPPNRPAPLAPTQQPNATPSQVSATVFDPFTKPTITYRGDVLFLNKRGKRVEYLAENGLLNGQPVGKLLGGGANSRVHKSSDPKFVKKLINLNWQENPEKGGATITDQNFGREILHGLNLITQSPLFRVAKLNRQEVVSAMQDDKKEYRFVFNREENITSDVYEGNDDPTSKVLIVDPSTEEAKRASNAEERANKRNPASNPPLTELEEFTINLVIRTLNDHGIVWTDHKLANLDIVRDERSPTGYQVIFFDFDGFRRVKGDTLATQAAAARDIQKAFDNPAIPNSNTPGDKGWEMMDNRVKQAYRHHYRDECKSYENANRDIPLDMGFNLTAFGTAPVRTLATPPANLNRTNYLYFNGLSELNFKRKVEELNEKYTRNIEFNPMNPEPIRIPVLSNKQP